MREKSVEKKHNARRIRLGAAFFLGVILSLGVTLASHILSTEHEEHIASDAASLLNHSTEHGTSGEHLHSLCVLELFLANVCSDGVHFTCDFVPHFYQILETALIAPHGATPFQGHTFVRRGPPVVVFS